MTDLHTALSARIDELERIAKAADAEFPGPWRHDHRHKWMYDVGGNHIDSAAGALGAYMAANDPATVLRGLAEDRDILARHASDKVPANSPSLWSCEACSHDGDPGRYVDWPCAEVLSLARRLGVEVES